MRIVAVVIFAGLTLAAPFGLRAEVVAQDNFTFKRLKAPGAGGFAGKRITVQIDPAEQARRLAVPEKPDAIEKAVAEAVAAPDGSISRPTSPAAPGASRYGWFWDIVPPARDSVSGRYTLAMATLSQGPGGKSVAAPRLQQMQTLASNYGTEILKATIGTEVSPALVLAVIGIESAGKVDALSSAGAQGLMQLIPATAERFGVTDSKDATQNIKGGVAYLNWLMKRFDHDPLMVIAAYNAGEGAIDANSGVPPFAETRDYVPKVLAAWQVAQGLCASPPELVSDPCVFKIISASN